MAGYILSIDHKNIALSLAEMTMAAFAGHRGHYQNNPKSHLVGRLGEFAAFHWLQDFGFEPRLSSERTQCDIFTNAGRCEVKTWSRKHWAELGRSISVSQLASIRRKADFIIWCIAEDIDQAQPQIEIRGWSDVAMLDKYEPRMTGKEGRQILNYQINDDEILDLALLQVLA